MAKSSDEIERGLDLKRQQLHARANRLRERVASDLRGMREETQAEVSGYVHRLEAQVSDHPWLAVAGGFSGGLALGLAKRGNSNQQAAQGRNTSSSQAERESLLSRGANALFGVAAGPVVDELRTTFEESLGEIRGTLKESVSDLLHGLMGSSSNGNSSNGTSAAAHRQRVRGHAA